MPTETISHDIANATALVMDAARADAKIFAAEFPGEQIDGDWDSEAWTETHSEVGAQYPGVDADDLWDTYRKALHAEVERLAVGSFTKGD